MVDHRIHGSCRYAEKETWTAQLLEITQVVAPVGLRHDGHTQPLGFQHTANNRHAERGVIDIGVAREENHIDPFPAALFQFLAGSGQPAVPIGKGCLHIYF